MTAEALRTLADRVKEASRYARLGAWSRHVRTEFEACVLDLTPLATKPDGRFARLAGNLAVAAQSVQSDPGVTEGYCYGCAAELAQMAERMGRETGEGGE